VSETSLFDAVPLLRVLTHVRNQARSARERSSVELEEMLDLGRRAHAVLAWFDADQKGDIEKAGKWLVQALSGLDVEEPSRPGSPQDPEE
jgi:hypothetical protein